MKPRRSTFSSAFVVWIFSVASALGANTPHYLVTNDDLTGNFIQNTMTVYTIDANGQLAFSTQVDIGVTGATGGYFAANRIIALNDNSNQCIFASDAATGQIASVNANTLTLLGHDKGSADDTGLSNGVGLALNGAYLYASYSDSSNIGTFQIQPDCGLSFVGDITVNGLQGGIVDGMAVHGNILIATYGDGSIESFNLSAGIPATNNDKQNSTGARFGNSYPSSIDITQDGHFAIFGDTSTSTLIEVSDISSGKLTATIPYRSLASISSSNIMLSPDEELLYISNTQGDAVSAAFFDKATGKLTRGCKSNLLKGYSSNFSYLAGLALATPSGNGGGLYAAEFGSPSSIAEVQLTSSNGACVLTETPNSPIADPNSFGLLSIATFPPRSF